MHVVDCFEERFLRKKRTEHYSLVLSVVGRRSGKNAVDE